MDISVFRLFHTAILTVLLVSCAAGPTQGSKAVPPGHLYKGSYLNVHAPSSNVWYLGTFSPTKIEFGRLGSGEGESFAAQVIWSYLPQTSSTEEFVAYIKTQLESESDSSRFLVVESVFNYTDVRGYPCVRGTRIVNDKHALVSPNHYGELVLQISSLTCRHPVNLDTVFSVIYSHRGKELYPNLAAEAEEFIAGVQVPEN